MTLCEYVELSTAIANTLVIVVTLFSSKAIFKWVWPKIRLKGQIEKLIEKRGCKECPKNEYIDYLNGGFCQWQNPASFGRKDLFDCKCFQNRS